MRFDFDQQFDAADVGVQVDRVARGRAVGADGLLEDIAHDGQIGRVANVDGVGQRVCRERDARAFGRDLPHRGDVAQALFGLPAHVAEVHGRVADDARGARDEQHAAATAGIDQRSAREGRAAWAIAVGIAVGADLARVLYRQRRPAAGKKVDAQRALARSERAGGGRTFKGAAARLDEGLLSADVELAVALAAAGLPVDVGEIVPHPQQVRARARGEHLEQVGVGAVRGGLQAVDAIVDFCQAVQPLAVGRVVHAAVPAFVDAGRAGPCIEHRPFAGEQRGVQRTGALPDPATAERRRRPPGRRQTQPAKDQRVGLSEHIVRARRGCNAHAVEPSTSRMLMRRRCQARTVRPRLPIETR